MKESSSHSDDDDSSEYEFDYAQTTGHQDDAGSSALDCPICRNPFVEPTLTPCEHVFCRRCLHRALARSPTCPIDRAPLVVSDLQPAPRLVHRLVDELIVRCPLCHGTFERGILAAHRARCGSGNGSGASGSTATSGGDRKGKRAVEACTTTPCSLCKEQLDVEAQKSHATTCPAVPLSCAYCSTQLTRSSLPAHLLNCPSIPVPCPHAVHGCPTRLPRTQLPEHLDVSCPFEPLKTFFDAYSDKVTTLEDENRSLSRRLVSVERDLGQLRDVVHSLQFSLGDFLSTPPPSSSLRQPSASASISSSESSVSPPPPASKSSKQGSRPPLTKALSTLSADMQSLSSTLSSLDARQSTEARLISEDVQSLRGGVHHVRMHLAYLVSELGRRPFPHQHLLHPVSQQPNSQSQSQIELQHNGDRSDGGSSSSSDDDGAGGGAGVTGSSAGPAPRSNNRFPNPFSPHTGMMFSGPPPPPPMHPHLIHSQFMNHHPYPPLHTQNGMIPPAPPLHSSSHLGLPAFGGGGGGGFGLGPGGAGPAAGGGMKL